MPFFLSIKNLFVQYKKFFFFLLFLIILAIIAIFAQLFMKPTLPTAKTFSLDQSYPLDFATGILTITQPTFVFTQKITVAEKDLGNYFHITPSVPGSWHVEKNGQVVYFSSDIKGNDQFAPTFAYNTVYTITIDNTFSSVKNQKLSKPVTVTFRTKQNPQFAYMPQKKLLNSFAGQPTTVQLNQWDTASSVPQGQLSVTVSSATKDQLLSYFVYKKNPAAQNGPLYAFSPNAQNTTIFTMQANVVPNTSGFGGSFSLPAMTTPGMYFVTLQNQYGSDNFFWLVTNIASQVFTDQNKYYTWTTDGNGQNIPGATSEFYSLLDNVSPQATATADDKGIAGIQTPVKPVDLVIGTQGQNIAITSTNRFLYDTVTGPTDTYQVFSLSDRPVYKPGDVIHYKAIVRKRDSGTLSNATGTVYAKFNFSNYVKDAAYSALQLDANGTVATDFTIPAGSNGNFPSITLSVKNGNNYQVIDTLSIDVVAYRKPDMDIKATTDKKEYISGDTATAFVTGKSLYGSPLSNIPFTYRVITSDYAEQENRSLADSQNYSVGYYGSGKELAAGTATFDQNGIATINFSTNLQNYSQSQAAVIEITPQIGASPSISRNTIIIHQGQFAIFYQNVQFTGTAITGVVKALNQNYPRGGVANQHISLSFYKHDPNNWNTKTLVGKQDVTTDGNGLANFSFNTTEKASFEIDGLATDGATNTVTGTTTIYTAAQQQATQNPYSITLAANKTQYKPGESAAISANANFSVPNAVVITTIYGGKQQYFYSNPAKIIAVTNTPINWNSWSFSVPILESYGKSVSVDVYSVYKQTIVSQHIDLDIDVSSKKISTIISFDKSVVKPGDTITATITTKDANGNPISADNAITVVDAAVLQISNFSNDIFNTFYSQYAHTQVAAYDSIIGIDNYSPPGGAGGGGGNDRINLVDTAYWNPHVQTNQNGIATVQFKVPDNLTTFTAVAYSNAGTSQFGQTSNSFISQKQVSIIPTIPNFYYQGDQPMLSALIQNTANTTVTGTAEISVKDINFTKSIPVTLPNNAFVAINAPATLDTTKTSLPFTFSIKDTNGNLLDSVTVTKPLLQKGNISSRFATFEGSKNITYASDFGKNPFSQLLVHSYSHPAIGLLNKNAMNFSDYLGASSGKNLVGYTYILKQTEDGNINPTVYDYATAKASFRDTMQSLLKQKIEQNNTVFWQPKDSYNNPQTVDLWITLGVTEALNNHLLDDIANSATIVAQAKTFIAQNSAMQNPSDTEQEVLRLWILGTPLAQPKAADRAEYEAVLALLGNTNAQQTLLQNALQSSNDRLIWETELDTFAALPALAIIDKGNLENVEKAVKGLATSYDSFDPFVLRAGVQAALREGITIDKTNFTIKSNNQIVYQPSTYANDINNTQTFFPQTTSSFSLSFQKDGPLPVYTDIAETNYQIYGAKPSLFNFTADPLNGILSGKTILSPITRDIKDLNGTSIPVLPLGSAGIITLQVPNGQFANITYPIGSRNSLYNISSVDGISPEYMYLDQSSGNSPQVQNVLDQLFPQPDQSTPSYIAPQQATDKWVNFNGYTSPKKPFSLPYVVYAISAGTYFQPKTSAVFTNLGLIANEQ